MMHATDFRRGMTRGIALLAGATALVDLLLLGQPLYMLQVYDRVLPSGSEATLLYVSLLGGGALVLLAVIDVVRSVLASRVATRLGVEAGTRAFRASVRAGRGDMQVSKDLQTLRSFVGGKGLVGVLDLPFAPVFGILLALVHPFLFLATALGAAVLVGLAVANRYACEHAGRAAGEAGRASSALLSSFTRSSGTIAAMGMEEHALGEWGRHEAVALSAQDSLARTNAVFAGASRSVRMGLQFAILGLGAWLVLEGRMTAGMIFASSMISGRALQPIDALVAGWPQVVEARAAWGRLRHAFAADAPRTATRLPDPKGRIEIRDLAVGHARNPVLRGISAVIEPGSVVAVVGASGAGKSTLAKAIVGAVPRLSGSVKVDGADIDTFDRRQFGGMVGYLDQGVDLLPGTVAQNIARFDPSATDEAIVTAATKAQVHDLVAGLPGGYGTPIAEGAGTLSGGQRQRVALARAFYGNPRVMVLDEPNASLDAEGDRALDRAVLQARVDGCTVVLVTQRHKVIEQATHIMVVADGTIAMYGPREEIRRRLQENVTAIGHPARPASAARDAA